MKVYIYDDRVEIKNDDGTVWTMRGVEVDDRRSAATSTTLEIQDGTLGSESVFGGES